MERPRARAVQRWPRRGRSVAAGGRPGRHRPCSGAAGGLGAAGWSGHTCTGPALASIPPPGCIPVPSIHLSIRPSVRPFIPPSLPPPRRCPCPRSPGSAPRAALRSAGVCSLSCPPAPHPLFPRPSRASRLEAPLGLPVPSPPRSCHRVRLAAPLGPAFRVWLPVLCPVPAVPGGVGVSLPCSIPGQPLLSPRSIPTTPPHAEGFYLLKQLPLLGLSQFSW